MPIKEGNMSAKIFKSTNFNQLVLLPEDIGGRIPANHPVRLVNEVVEMLNIDTILAIYKGGGSSAYHPRLMLKILFYSYLNNIYSSRKMEKALQENIYFMWISGNSIPDFRTINLFRGKRLKNYIHLLFSEVVKLMSELGYVSLKKQFIDGTIIEAQANKYTFVWRGSAEKNKEKLENKIIHILKEIESAIKSDDSENNPEIKSINSQELRERIQKLNEGLDKLDKQQKKKLKELEIDQLARLENYEEQLNTLGDRNSYSKTDTDASFMRMKEDRLGTGELKPAYNVQISTENQVITNFTLHQTSSDTVTLASHLQQSNELFGARTKQAITDAGYGSEENYEMLNKCNIEGFIPYQNFRLEQKKKFKNNAFLQENLFYNQEKDYFVCPMGQHLNKVGVSQKISARKYVSNVTYYQATRCAGCPLRSGCFKGEGPRLITVNHQLIEYKQYMRKKLLSPEGQMLRKQRSIEPEAVFGQIKNNNSFTRFRLRGLDKVQIEFGLIAIAHNLRKWAKYA